VVGFSGKYSKDKAEETSISGTDKKSYLFTNKWI